MPFDAINNVLSKIKNISIAGAKPFSGLISTISVPEIPELAKGGVLKRGQVGLLEGSGAEAVVPLERNRRWIRAVADEMQKQLAKDVQSIGSSVSVTNSPGITQNFYQYNNSPKALSRLEIYRQTKNQFAFAKGV